MPAIEVPDASFRASPTLERPLFKSHKNLPRRQDIGPHVDVLQIFSDRDAGPVNGSAIATAPALPLTPPVVAEEDDRSTESDPQMDHSIKSDHTIQALTPRTQRLLTPETTPPRATSSHRLDVSQLTQPLSSSRAESFRTACENIPSDAETDTSYLSTRSVLQSSRLTAQAQRPLPENGRQTVASYSGGVNTPRDQSSDSGSVFSSSHERSIDTRRRGHREEASDITPTPKNPFSNGDRQKITHPADASDLEVQRSGSPQTRGRSLRSRVRDVQNDKETPSVEQFGEEIGWPSAGNPSNPTDLPGSRRLSGGSTTSTVEAIIIDTPAPVKRTLRHTEKRLSLRSASSPIPKSVRASLASNADSHRLTHKVARITDQDRRSIISELSDSAASTLGAVRSNIEVVPVIVIPERRSSLWSSSMNSRDQSTTCSRRSSQRTTVAPGSRTGSVDRSRRRTRTASDSTPRPSQETDPRGYRFSQPVIPPRSSSLSAPTSRNNSRAPSPTSETRRHHITVVDTDAEKPQTKPDVAESHNDTLNRKSHDSQGARSGHLRVGSDDTGELRSPSLPFTQGSIHSLSPGPVEINEATAVSFFPHNNRSLLLIDPNTVPESRAVQAVRESYLGKLNGPHTPEASSQTLQVGVDSPLRNPRPPPKPPIVKVLPPTPSDEIDRQIAEQGNFQGQNGAISRRFGSVRRALSARQRTDSSNFVRRSFSTSAKNPRAEKVMDGRLHSFWLPRRFWDDSAETSPEDEASSEQNRENNQIISNSLGMPQQQLIFEGPRLPRRSPDMRRLADGSPIRYYPSRSQLIDGRMLSPDILRTGSPLHQRRFRSIRWLKLRFRPLRLHHLRKRMRRSMQRWEEKKWEARRENLKRSIGDIVHVDSSMNLNTVQPSNI